jgi:hypothetical protein
MEIQSNVFISYLDELLKLKLLLEQNNNDPSISRVYMLEKINRAINEIPIVLHPSLLVKLANERLKYSIVYNEETTEEV